MTKLLFSAKGFSAEQMFFGFVLIFMKDNLLFLTFVSCLRTFHLGLGTKDFLWFLLKFYNFPFNTKTYDPLEFIFLVSGLMFRSHFNFFFPVDVQLLQHYWIKRLFFPPLNCLLPLSVSLPFCKYLGISLSMSTKTPCWDSKRNLEKIDIFTLLRLLTHEHCTFLHLLRFLW